MNPCANCGSDNDAHMDDTGTNRTPDVGDLMMCATCGYLTEYVSESERKHVTIEMLREADERVMHMIAQAQFDRVMMLAEMGPRFGAPETPWVKA